MTKQIQNINARVRLVSVIGALRIGACLVIGACDLVLSAIRGRCLLLDPDR
jgi:hypothetical protein